MKTFDQIVAETTALITEVMPWDLAEKLSQQSSLILIDVREADEFAAMRIADSINIPRGILETACDYGYDDTIPEIAAAREQDIVVICRSGRRSCMAAHTMQQLGFTKVKSLKTGLRGWNDFDQELVNHAGDIVDGDDAEEFLQPKVRPEQQAPK